MGTSIGTYSNVAVLVSTPSGVAWRGEARRGSAGDGRKWAPLRSVRHFRVLKDAAGCSRVLKGAVQGAHKMKKIEDMTGAVNKPGLRHECVMPELVISANCDQAKAQCPMALCGNAGCDGRHSSARVLERSDGTIVRTYVCVAWVLSGGASTVLRRRHCVQG